MAKFEILNNKFSQQYMSLPLTFKNVSGSDIIVKEIYVENIIESPSGNDNNIIFYLDEEQSNYDNVEKLYMSNYQVSHSGYIFNSNSQNKKDKISAVFNILNNNNFEFVVIFNPNVSKHQTLKGEFNAKIRFMYTYNLINTFFYIDLHGRCSDKGVEAFMSTPFNNVSSVFKVNRSRIKNIN